MFDNLSDRFQGLFKRLRGQGVLKEQHLQEAHAELKKALFEADVHQDVVEKFVAEVDAAVIGKEIIKSLKPAEQYLAAVHDQLVSTFGSQNKLTFGGRSPHVVLCVGLQGSGKTTSAAKLAYWCKSEGRTALLVPADLQRPAAIEQLKSLGREWDLKVFDTQAGSKPTDVVRAALNQAREQMTDVVIIDTAGRLHIDQELMSELASVRKIAEPEHTLLVVDAMAGQQGLEVAKGFNQTTPLTSVIISKADGDARGGVALSCRAVLNIPITFVGMGEKVDALEVFYPERMASRILDMGDLAGLVEKVQSATDTQAAAEMVKKLGHGKFTLEDFRQQMKEISKVGQMEGILKMLPGARQMMAELDMGKIEKDLSKKEAIINSMTYQERANSKMLNGSRRKRIASGSGSTVTDVNRLVKEFETFAKMMKKGGGKNRGRMPQLPPQMMQMLGGRKF